MIDAAEILKKKFEIILSLQMVTLSHFSFTKRKKIDLKIQFLSLLFRHNESYKFENFQSFRFGFSNLIFFSPTSMIHHSIDSNRSKSKANHNQSFDVYWVINKLENFFYICPTIYLFLDLFGLIHSIRERNGIWKNQRIGFKERNRSINFPRK